MSTQALIHRLLDGREPAASVIDVLHQLLDDSAAEPSKAVGIAQAAAMTGLTPTALRYYEAEGLIRPDRDPSGYRSYEPRHLRRVVFLTRMRLSGMGMSDLKRYIRLVDEGDDTIPERREIMTEQRDRIRAQLRELELALATTEYKIASYDGAPSG